MPDTTQAVLDHHMTAIDSGDIEAMLSDYAPDVLLFTPEGLFRGHDQLRPVLQRVWEDVFSTCSAFQMIQQLVEGEVAYIVWSAESETLSVRLATDTYIVRNGKIVVQTFAAKIEPRTTHGR